MATCPLTTREAIKAALDIAKTSRANWLIDDAIAAATPLVEGLCHRSFRPEQTTHRYSWPNLVTPTQPWRLWLDRWEVITIDQVTIGGVTLTPASYVLRPDSGPPYTGIEANLSTLGGFSYSGTHQNAAVITGLFGYTNDETTAGLLASSPGASDTTLTVTDGARVGVGDLLRIDSERLIVTDRDWAATGATLNGALTESQAGRAVTVTDGTLFHRGELILVDTETMRVTDIVGNQLTCRRAWDGSTLAAHADTTPVYASRALTVTRGALGTTAAAHTTSTAIQKHTPPALVERLARAETLNLLGAELTGYATEAGSGATSTKAAATPLGKLREDTAGPFARNPRFR